MVRHHALARCHLQSLRLHAIHHGYDIGNLWPLRRRHLHPERHRVARIRVRGQQQRGRLARCQHRRLLPLQRLLSRKGGIERLRTVLASQAAHRLLLSRWRHLLVGIWEHVRVLAFLQGRTQAAQTGHHQELRPRISPNHSCLLSLARVRLSIGSSSAVLIRGQSQLGCPLLAARRQVGLRCSTLWLRASSYCLHESTLSSHSSSHSSSTSITTFRRSWHKLGISLYRCALRGVRSHARLVLINTQRPAGFSFDLFLLGCTTFVSGILGLPAPNGLVPQAPVNTASLCVTKQVPAEIEDRDGVVTEEQLARALKDEDRQFSGMHKTVTTRVVEQRVSHLAMGVRPRTYTSRCRLMAISS